ncbi:unnamed protein product (macronuclear) [Paramecium tetraurelia]|uniref:Uncharacterized protein n=1 Tax=Paramecium tetraurelia TaxID=5888 RepID=A0C7M6_PARTE|nr:uncharacterized protein GSPATT00035923001 [Paramecium tetraurelia]CAK66793.1 unnamed protein product [Paramecium tetraurelia]|eukprot:XP_001434190.1 hypothetical protein (macronuclear) [Paramecium tetraurelia strain d4-2]
MQNKEINRQDVLKIDKFLRREKIFKNEKKLNELHANYYQGIQLNKKELHQEAIKLLDYKVTHPDDLEIYISSSSITNKPLVYKHPLWLQEK